MNYVSFEKAFKSIPVGKLKLQANGYLLSGQFPIVDQGQLHIAGYTDDEKLVNRENLPVIVFGDHTRVVKYVDFPFVVGADGVRLFQAKEGFDSEFLYFFLRNVKLPNDGYGRHSKHLENLEIPLYEPYEQKFIVANLKTQLAAVEEARNAAQTQVKDSELLIPAILEKTFAEIADAQMKRICDVFSTTSGTTPSRSQKSYWESGKTPWVKTGEVAFEPITATGENVTETALNECSLPLLPPGSVLVAMYGQGKTRGQSAALKIEATTNQACFAILPNERMSPEFLQYWLRHSYKRLRTLSEARGGNQSNLNGEMLNAFEVPIISVEKQQALVRQISGAIEECNALQKSLLIQLAEINLLPAKILAKAFDIGA